VIKFIILGLFTISIIPSYAENFTVNTNNQTIIVTIYPEIHIDLPINNNTTPQNLSTVESMLEPITTKWSESDILMISSTIFGFFTFGSFLIVRFEGKRKSEQAGIMQIILLLITTIQISHLIIIATVILNTFRADFFIQILVLTAGLLLIILGSLWRLIDLANQEQATKDVISPAQEFFELEMKKRIDAEIERDNLQRELQKEKRLSEG